MRINCDLQAWAELDAAWRKAPDIVRQEALAAMTEADTLMEREVGDAMPTATGRSRASLFSREEALPDGGVLGVVGSTLPHIAYVELGTRPHFPPIQALEDWVYVKFGYTSEKRVHGIALAIARKIAARGTLGVGMFHRSYARLQPRLEGIFSRARDRIALRLGEVA